MKKISIITPIYNESNNIEHFLCSIEKIKYSHTSFELVLINDGSMDETLKIITDFKKQTKIDLKIISFRKNRGRAYARHIGSKKAKYDLLFFLDCRCVVFPDALIALNSIKYQPLLGVAIQETGDLVSRFFHKVRKKIYKDSFSSNFKDLYINESNFNHISKGMATFFCNRKLFLKCQIKNLEDKDSSDDTKLLQNIIRNKPILKTARIKVTYYMRSSLWENLLHIYKRGPKFSDYYINNKGPFFSYYLAIIFLILSSVIVALFFPAYIIIAYLFLLAFIAFYLAGISLDAIFFIPLLVLFGLFFVSGVAMKRFLDFIIIIFTVILVYGIIAK
ncbi:hypothetical protein CO123_01465 [bacterium (Candidatus Howlettbacteria) CG_4_9_14_3_um_filter_37_10]|nr:MAG: hypothetical protein COX25_05315 [bacterium (Candidatus Howlettbacteria) CG23_combo_of_CG06-09_8_20_14_all_37_9]PJB06742.1 MAG: hypothetical protein CO123_01465 [bacterium (Candidatus Howlettbacteria) CG_4_9_14_3_um_filter_37_10]